MLGAIAGDVIGSIWEGTSCDALPHPLVTEYSQFTDDTVCTVAVADALLNNKPIAPTLREWVRRYPGRGYGGMFYDWSQCADAPAYQSFANGAAMRVSPVALLANSAQQVIEIAAKTACVTHDHPDGLRGAQAIAMAIWYARCGVSAKNIRRRLQHDFNYPLDSTVKSRSALSNSTVLANVTVPDALIAALEATSYESAIRNAIAIGGDSDTIACMAGGIAEARFGIPASLATAVREKLPEDILTIIDQLYQVSGQSMLLKRPIASRDFQCELPQKGQSFMQRISRIWRYKD